MKLSRNKISKLIKKKKHSRSKNHKKRDDHTVVFSKSKDYDKPITRKKGGGKGYHGRSYKRTMKRVYRGGGGGGDAHIPAIPVIQAENVNPIEEPINTVKVNKAVPLDNGLARQAFINNFEILNEEFNSKYGTELNNETLDLDFLREWRSKMMAVISTYNNDNLKLAYPFVDKLNETLLPTINNGSARIYDVDYEKKLQKTIQSLMSNINDSIAKDKSVDTKEKTTALISDKIEPTKVNEPDSGDSDDDNLLFHNTMSKADMQNKKKEVEKVALEAAALSDSTPTTTSVPVPTPDTAISANDLQTMQQKSADALKSAQDHHAKVQDLVKANPLATLTADTYNFDDCTADMSMAKKEIVGPNPEYRKAQPKCKPFIDKTITERKQWVDGMKNAVTLENPSEKCATFSDSESKKIDDYAKKCAKQENQVVVNITEAPINDTHKRMNITVFAPNKSEVVLQDYAHSTYEQTMHNFEDLKMDGELDLSGLTNAASAAKDAVKKAASATITAAKSAATTVASATKQAASKAKEAVTGTGTGTTRATPDATATPDAPDAPDATATPAGPGIIGKIKNYLKKGQIQEMRETMDNLQDVSDQLSDSMTPSQAEKQEDLVEEINSLIKALSRNDTAAVTQVGGDQQAVNGAQIAYEESKKKYDKFKDENSSDEDKLKASEEVTLASLAMSKATLQHLKEINKAPASTIQDKIDASIQHNTATKVHREAALNHHMHTLTNTATANEEFNKAAEASNNAPLGNETISLGSQRDAAELKLKNATEYAAKVNNIQKNAIESLKQSNESLLDMHEIKHKQTKVALDKARTNLNNNVKVVNDSTKNIVETTKATKQFKNALTDHTKATEDINNTQQEICNSKHETEQVECNKKLQDDKVKRADEVNKLSKSESDDGKALLDVANTKVSEMKVSKRQQDITNLMDTYEIILNKLRKMNGGPGAKKGNIMVSQSVLDNMNSLLDKMISQQEIIVKALGKITPENDKFTNQSKEVSGFLFKGVKEYVASNVSVPDTVIKNGIENINTKLVEYKDKIKKDVLSKDARNFSKAVIDSAIAANEPIKSVNNRVTIWREIMKYIRTDVLKLNPIEELDLLAQDLSNLLKTIKDTPMSNEDQTKIVKIIKEINRFLYSKPLLNKLWDSIVKFFELVTFDQIDINQQNKDKENEDKENEDKEKPKYFTTLSGDKPKEYDEKVKQFESKLIDIKEKLETLEQEMEYSGPSQTEITDTNATTIYSILEKIKDQARNLSANVNNNTQNQVVNTLGEVTRIKTDFLFTGDNENDDLKNLLTKLSNNDKNKLFDIQTIPIEEKDKAIYDTSIKNIIESWNNALSEINKIIKSNSKPQTGGKNRHSKKSKKRKSKSNLKSKSSRVKLTRKSSKK